MKLARSFRIGTCLVNPLEYTVVFDIEGQQSLQPKFIDVLSYLASHYPRIIPRDELIDEIWQGNGYVGKKALTNAVWNLRKNLAPACPNEEVIETIRNVGYRLLIEPQWQGELATKENSPASIQATSTDGIPSEQTPQIKTKYSNPIAMTTLVVLVALLSSYFFLNNNSDHIDHSNNITTVTQMTKAPGSELFASPSPDGKYIVYKSFKPEKAAHLFLQDTSQPQLPRKQLTFGDVKVGHSVWSNDGKYLYFTQKNIDKDVDKNSCSLMRLNVRTNQNKILSHCTAKKGYYYIDISPDNTVLAYHSYSDSVDDPGIYFLSLVDDDPQPIPFSCTRGCEYEELDMAFSPDGKMIAVTRRFSRFSENIYLIDLNSKKTTQLTHSEEDIEGLTWHPSGEYIVYGSQHADIRSAYAIKVSDKSITPLQIEGFSYPAYAKNTAELFYQQRDENYHVASLKLHGTVAASPFPVIQSDFNHHYPDYSTRANKLVYVSNESGFYELWLADESGENREKLTSLKQTIRYPKWSYNGKKVAFIAPTEQGDKEVIYLIDIASKKISILPSNFNRFNRPTWSYDDKHIITAVFERDYTDLFQIEIDTGLSKRLTYNGGLYGVMISNDIMLYTRDKRGLWQKNINDESPSVNIIRGKTFGATYTWAYHDTGIYYRQNRSKHQQISFYDFAKRTRTTLARLPLKTVENYGSLTFIAKHKKLIFTASHFPQVDIKRLSDLHLH
jgi:Tol biopolymer transport system component/DNA-binding winged helix-turn-helix (wHTH) protein